MSELEQQIRADLKESMKARDKQRSNAIRQLLSAVQYEKTSSGTELVDADILAVIAREIKKRRESVTTYCDAGREELAAVEEAEIAVFQSYQPAQLSDVELEQLVDSCIAETGASSMREMGAVMKTATAQAAGRADGARISAVVKAKLS
ncbi:MULTISPECIES: GatB/YqeY domain-containing protein [Corynebacterium]|uniref:GatB/YqeY domain-containing protein n=1 Tax=Corynebacterium TaxID=1716 RepID=UPI00124BEBC7|nr:MULTISPECIES: GatB/YqeY domain-containing protein [Corynebacterium]